jgi:prepilin-type N-terminal cleavage/methylation domain-containing protein
MRSHPKRRRADGFTLLELVVSVALIGVLAAVGSSIVYNSFDTASKVNAGNTSSDEARYALERLAREIREVKFRNAGNYCIDTMTATQLVFDKPNAGNDDRVTCSTGSSKVTINQSGTNLTLLYGTGTASTLTSKVASSGFAFAYLQSDGTTVATSNATVYFVQVTLTVTEGASGSSQSIAQRIRVALRNS